MPREEITLHGFLRLSEVLKIIPVSKSSWYAGVASGRYPKPIAISVRAKDYRAQDIAQLINRLTGDKKRTTDSLDGA